MLRRQEQPDGSVSIPQQTQDHIDAAAADWAARLAGPPLSVVERRALARWQKQSAAHRAALAEARTAWALMCRVAGEAQVIPLPRRPAHRARTWLGGMALAASMLLAVLTGFTCWTGDPMVALMADYRTDVGQTRMVALADGSVVRLGPASAIALRYDGEVRRVELLAGQADFTAAPRTNTEPRPFEVMAGTGTARALGTRFLVNRLPDAVEVAVAEHTVEVISSDSDGLMARALVHPGQAVRYGEAGMAPVTPLSYAQAAAWQEGALVFDRVALAEVVAILNRYRHDRLVLGDSALAARTVSGVFQTGNTDAALAAIRQALDIHSASLPPVATVLY